MKKIYEDLLSLDIGLGASALSDEMLRRIPPATRQHNLLCWDIAAQGLQRMKHVVVTRQLKSFARRFDWNMDGLNFERSYFDAVVLTDVHQRIGWVSNGFRGMTGYRSSEVLNRKPSFLQGPATDQATLHTIREAITNRQPVKAVLVNYRKDQSVYHCHVDMMPLLNRQRVLTHFIAFETALD
jgi:PAS domain S-box-containing protein